jgi:polyisoprenyl-phosphate glycosyltransferase
MISIVSPVYRAELIVAKLVNEIRLAMKDCEEEYEIILVDDGSPDESWKQIELICEQSKDVVGIKLSRNFGQHYAITAGLENANGNWVVVMDCDLQDRPQEISRLFNKTKEGFDLVVAKRTFRKDSFLKRFSSRIFYSVFTYLTDINYDKSIANFGIYSKDVIDAVLSMKDHVRAFPILVQWVGFNRAELSVQHDSRFEGKSTYSWSKLLSLASEVIISFSTKPMKLILGFGFMMMLLSFLVGLYILILSLAGEITVPGYSSVIVSIFMLSGVIICILGIVGMYLGQTFMQTKSRPLYVIGRKINHDR